ncbi:MAG: hypothetical protein R3E42_10785 [Burkholderiaceae bacterium]
MHAVVVPVPSMPENSGQALSVTPGASQRNMNITSRPLLPSAV